MVFDINDMLIKVHVKWHAVSDSLENQLEVGFFRRHRGFYLCENYVLGNID